MQGSFDNMYKIADHLNDGMFSLISKDLSIAAMTDMIDLFYKNVDYCNFEAVIGTYQSWCLDNMEVCTMEGTDIFANLESNALPLMSKGFDLFNLIMSDDSCVSDEQVVGEAERVAEDMTSIMASLIGFDAKWDSSAKMMSDKDYDKQYTAKY